MKGRATLNRLAGPCLARGPEVEPPRFKRCRTENKFLQTNQNFDNISSKFVVEDALGSVAVALANVSSCSSQATQAASIAS